MKMYYFPIKISKKIISTGIIFFIALFFSLNNGNAQVQTTEGTDFWVTFISNLGGQSSTNLTISAQRACTGTISNPNTGWTTSFSIPAQGRIDVPIPTSEGYCLSNRTIENKGLWVVSTDTISLFASNYIHQSFDATNVLPTPALGNEYLIQTYRGGIGGSNFAVLAIENNTILDITPSRQCGSISGLSTITLNRGQVYQLITDDQGGDLSGSTVKSRDCKQFAVFAGCLCSYVPILCGYCDHLTEQTWPTTSWGNNFVVTLSMGRYRDLVRITASANGTQIYRDGVFLSTIDAGVTGAFELSSPSNPSSFIHTTNPVAVNLYLTGSTYGGSGDPSMIWISPIEQRIPKITFGTFSPGQTLWHYINIVSPTNGVSSMSLDGNNISNQFSIVPGNPNYSFARMSITHATHTLQGDSGFTAHVYGLGVDESYAYSIGSKADNLANRLFINNIASIDIASNQEYCMNDTLVFRGDIETSYDGIIWDFGDGQTGTGDTVIHIYPTYGYYTVNMIVDRRSSNNNCGGYDTISTFVRIIENEINLFDSICAGVHYTENGLDLIATHDTSVTIIYPSFWGCDSIIHLYIYVFPFDTTLIIANICEGEFYSENGFNISATQVSLITDTLFLSSSFGCDSIVVLYLNVNPLPIVSLGNDRIICSEDEFPIVLDAGNGMTSYIWNTGETSQTISVMEEGIYSVTVSSGGNCTATDEITIELHDVTVTIYQTPEDFCINSMAVLTAHTEASSILWNTGETTSSINISQNGSYFVSVSNDYCIDTDSIFIPECFTSFYIPNTITPYLNDGINDYFEISGYIQNIKELEIYIYDRWGQLVFESKQINFRWDGKIYGKFIPNHIFSYVMIIKTMSNKKEIYKGIINVL